MVTQLPLNWSTGLIFGAFCTVFVQNPLTTIPAPRLAEGRPKAHHIGKGCRVKPEAPTFF